MATRNPGKPDEFPYSERIHEIFGLLLVAVALFFALALWTFHASDPSWNDRVGEGWVVRNFAGFFGAYVAGGLVHLLGVISFLVPAGILAWGVAAFTGYLSWWPGWRALGWLVATLSGCGLFYKAFEIDPVFGDAVLAGGWVGYGVSALLLGALGSVGSVIVLVGVFLAALVATTGLSLSQLLATAMSAPVWLARRGAPWLWRRVRWAGAGCRSGGQRFWGGIREVREKLRREVREGKDRALAYRAALAAEGPPLLEGAGGDETAGPEGGMQKPAGLFARKISLFRKNGTGTARPVDARSMGGPSLGASEAVAGGALLKGPVLPLPGPGAIPAAASISPSLEVSGGAVAEVLPGTEAPEEERLEMAPGAPSLGGGLRIGRSRSGAGHEKWDGVGQPGPVFPLSGAPEEIAEEIAEAVPLASEPRGDAPVAPAGEDAPEIEPIAGVPGSGESGPRGPAFSAGNSLVRTAALEENPEIVRIGDDSIVQEEGLLAVSPKKAKRASSGQGSYVLPEVEIFSEPPRKITGQETEEFEEKSRLLEKTLHEFGVAGEVVRVNTGPVITIYEFNPAAGIKVAKIASLSDDLARALSAISVRVVAPIPGTSVVGIEIPNKNRSAVYLKEMVGSREFRQAKEKLTVGLGVDVLGHTTLTDLAKIPHLLIAGTTGSGKSVLLNMMICSLLIRCMPREVRMLMIDPKMLELSIYEGVPHLLVPVVTDPKKAASALRGVVAEMERRYKTMSRAGVRSIESYNAKIFEKLGEKEAKKRLSQPLDPAEKIGNGGEEDFLPYIVVVVDELADLMMVSSREVEDSLARLAQMARAAGIHLLVATQRPSVDVLTGVIKANFPSRIALRVATRTDSRTIMDANGADRLLGKGDMLFIPPGSSSPIRIHGAFVAEKEIRQLVEHWQAQGPAAYQEEIFAVPEKAAAESEGGEDEFDERYDEAVALVTRTREASISLIQRHLRVGYNRAARMIEQMEVEGVIGPADGVKRRQVLVQDILSDGAGSGALE